MNSSHSITQRTLDRPSLVIRRIALTGTLSAVYLVFRAIPIFPMIFLPGSFFRAGDMIAPLYGILLGPVLGPVAIAIGTIAGYPTVAPSFFLGFDFLPASVCSAISGLLVQGRKKIATVLYAVLLLVFLLSPFTARLISFGGTEVPYNWLHIAGLLLLVSPLTRYAPSVRSSTNGTSALGQFRLRNSSVSYQVLLILLIAFIGTLGQHLTGGIMTEALFGLNYHTTPARFASWQAYWTVIFFLYPIERSIIAVVATVIATPVLLALRSSRIINRLP